MNPLESTYTSFDTSALALGKAKPLANKEEKDLQQAKETAQDFEAFFMTKTMESMFEGVSTEGMFGGGHAEKIYRSMLLDEYGKAMAKTGNIGISDSIMQSILDMQEAQNQGKTLKEEVQNGRTE